MLSLAAALLAAAATPAPAASPAGIIPLPLQPVVPASQRTCSAKTASGLGIQTLKAAEGAKAGATDFVLINYIGYLAATGAVFDQAMTTPMQVDAVIPGFSEGLKLIPRGAIWRLCIPAAQGYGAEGSGPIPANSDLVFQVELLDSRTQAEVAAMQAAASAPAAEAPAAAPAAGK